MQLPNFQIQTGRSWRDCKIFPWTFLASNILLRTFPRPDNFHPHLGHQPPGCYSENFKIGATPDPNRSAAVNFVHANSRPLYIVDWRMMIVGGGLFYTM